MAEDKFCFVPLGIGKIEGLAVSKGKYVFSTGRSNRNYDFLIEALAGTNFEIRIACNGYQYKGLSDTSKVTILHNCFGRDMLRELSGAFCVVIPLGNVHISSGQLVILQALQLGKPVIVTENDTVKDYINDGENGYIIKNERDALISRLERIEDDIIYNTLSKNAKIAFNANNSLDGLAGNIWKAISCQ